ncbi:MAG: M61 family peptidase [Gemmatimonadota bacterium]|nr:M61 family peptidase [Gemmatimonadota bacterium]
MNDPWRRARPIVALVLSCGACAAPSESQPTAAEGAIVYRVAFPNAVHHEAEVEVTFPALASAPLEVRMSRTSPGRYALHEFAKNVYNVRITDGAGRRLQASRPDLHQWTVMDHDGTVIIRYTLFADRIDGTYASVDREGAMLNIPASMMWSRGLEDRPIEIRFLPPEGSGWVAATQLVPTEDPLIFTAPNQAYFLDSPVLLAELDIREWTVESEGTSYSIRFALHHEGSPDEVDRYVENVKKVVDQEVAVFGELPAFDYGTYTFLASYLPWAAGDGMEHRNSTVLSRQGHLAQVELSALGTVAHEFFHAWNIERIRPASLEPFDFEAADISQELWFGEGFTSYYDDLAMVRAGVIDVDEFASRMGSLVNTVTNSPGRRFYSPIEMSMQAPFVDAAVSVDPQNRTNTFISYYTWGAALGLALDLSIRDRFSGKSLDDFMRAMWIRHGKDFRPYDVGDLETVLGDVVGDAEFASSFFDRYVRGTDRDPQVPVPDYAALLARAGFLVEGNERRPWVGSAGFEYGPDGAAVRALLRMDTPLYRAGIERDDVLVSLDGEALIGARVFNGVLDAHRPGDRIPVVWRSRGGEFVGEIVVESDPNLTVRPAEAAGGSLSAGARAFRNEWLSPR